MRKSDMDKATALKAIERESAGIIGISNAIWDKPECGLGEKFASGLICDYLAAQGFEVERGLCGIPTAFRATYGCGEPRIGLLAEYDALQGLGHGCGHNLLAGGCIGAAVAIKEYLQACPDRGTLVFFGCPDEEVSGTKTYMARDGVFDDLDFALAWHPAEVNIVPFGISSALYDVQYTFKGRANHSALDSDEVHNALDAAELMNIGVKYLNSQYHNQVNIGYSYANTGSDAPNMVKDSVTNHFVIRTRKLKDISYFVDRIGDIAKGAALMSATEVESRIVGACSGLIPNRELAAVLYENFQAVGAPSYTDDELAAAGEVQQAAGAGGRIVKEMLSMVDNANVRRSLSASLDGPMFAGIIPPTNYEVYSPASTDVGDVSRACPVGQINVATAPIGVHAHTRGFLSMGKTDIAHKGMLTASKVIAAAAIDLMENPAKVQIARNDFLERTSGHKYRSLLPDDAKLPVM